MLGYRLRFDYKVYCSGQTFVIQKSAPDGYDYLLRIPKGYHDFTGPMPLLIFLHGAGEVGTDPKTLVNKAPFHIANEAEIDFPYIGVMPICPEKRWEPYRVIAMLNQVMAETRFRFQADSERIYLTGYSMGGFGTFETAMEFPERFAAIVPVAGGGEPGKAAKLQDIPTWVFHGENDKTVPLPSSARVVEAMEQNGHNDVKITVIPGAGHGIARQVYSNPYLYNWLQLKKKKVSDSFDGGADGNTGNFIDSGSSGQNLTNSVVPEEFHVE